MAARRPQTIVKRQREQALREKRERKQAKKDQRAAEKRAIENGELILGEDGVLRAPPARRGQVEADADASAEVSGPGPEGLGWLAHALQFANAPARRLPSITSTVGTTSILNRSASSGLASTSTRTSVNVSWLCRR
jgi:hypothetical protein